MTWQQGDFIESSYEGSLNAPSIYIKVFNGLFIDVGLNFLVFGNICSAIFSMAFNTTACFDNSLTAKLGRSLNLALGACSTGSERRVEDLVLELAVPGVSGRFQDDSCGRLTAWHSEWRRSSSTTSTA